MTLHVPRHGSDYPAGNRDAPRCLPILMYHSIGDSRLPLAIDRAEFAKQMRYLKRRGFRGAALSESLNGGHISTEAGAPIAITFDDGYADGYDTALPVLAQLGFRATMFIVSRFVDSGKTCGDLPSLSWSQLRELNALGVEIGAHTRTHPDLRGLDAATLREEIGGAKHDLQDKLGVEVKTFAYPYGRYSDAAREAVREAGFDAACAIHVPRPTEPDRYMLQRTCISYRDGMMRFRIKVSTPYQRLLQKQLASLLTVR